MAKKHTTRDTTQDTTSERQTAQYLDQRVMTGAGGEVHQSAGGATPVLTTQQGVPVADDQNSLKIGARGPTALADFHLREKLLDVLVMGRAFDVEPPPKIVKQLLFHLRKLHSGHESA